MKLVKMSLAAAVLLGASAFAIDNVKVNGDAKLYYATDDQEYTGTDGQRHSGLFDQTSSAGQAALRLGITADLTKGVSAGATLYALSTLGLENNLVGNVWESGVKDQYWFGEAWLAATAGKTTAKVGRMELDTPFAFTEKWSIVPNTFEAMVLINQDLPDTTLVGAYVGKSNGSAVVAGTGYGSVINSFENITYRNHNGVAGFQSNSIDDQISDEQNNNFGSFYQGAYAAGAINNSFKPLVAQAWYYNVKNVADAFWLQADWDCQLVKDVKVGVQYAGLSPKDAAKNTLAASDLAHAGQKTNADTTGYAAQLAYAGIKDLKLSAAYSDVDSDGGFNLANIATTSGNSKLYTEAWWNYGYISAPGAESYKLAADYDAGFAKLGLEYTDASVKATGSTQATTMQEVALTVSKSFGPLDTTLAYINTDANDQNRPNGATTGYTGRSFDTIQAYLTLNF